MGRIRKVSSIMTLGLIRWNSSAEKAAKRQLKVERQRLELERERFRQQGQQPGR